MSDNISWQSETEEKFRQLIAKVPGPLQSMAEEQVSKKAQAIVKEDNRKEICEKDLVDAFFEVTPFGFHGPLKSDMESLGINYAKYGHPQ